MVDKKAIGIRLGANLKRLRAERDLSMQDLANLAEIEKSQIYRIENARGDVKLTTLYILAEALNVDVSVLLKPEIDPMP